MNRQQLEHLIRAAADIADDEEIIVVGSQSILGAYPDAPAPLRMSDEADLFPKNYPERAAVIDGAIGELSMFHDTFHYYAQGVGPETALLSTGWRDRLVPVRTRGVVGWCLEPHDLVASKLLAARDKDVAFARVALDSGLVHREVVHERITGTPTDDARLARALALLSQLT